MIELLESVNLEGYVVIIPSVCVGNVGQLTADLIINSLNLKKLGYVWHPYILSLAGPDPYGRLNNLSIGCELYFSSHLKVLVFQIRTTITRSNYFVRDLVLWLESCRVKQVVILTGSSAHERRDCQLLGEPLRYMFCPLTKKEELQNAVHRNWIELEHKGTGNDYSSVKPINYIPGSGLAIKLFKNCVNKSIPCSILLNFCSDGNNIPDAMKLADYADEWLQLKKNQKVNQWIIPPSWNLVFGANPPFEIFN